MTPATIYRTQVKCLFSILFFPLSIFPAFVYGQKMKEKQYEKIDFINRKSELVRSGDSILTDKKSTIIIFQKAVTIEEGIFLPADTITSISRKDSGSTVIKKTAEYLIFNKDELQLLLTALKLFGAETIENTLRSKADRDGFGDMHEIILLEKTARVLNSKTIRLYYKYDIADFLSQPIGDDCNCYVATNVDLTITVDQNSNLIGKYIVPAEGAGVFCPWCPFHSFVGTLMIFSTALQGKPIIENTVQIFDQIGFRIKLNNFLIELRKKVTVTNNLYSVVVNKLEITDVRFTNEGMFVTVGYEFEIK